MKKTADTVECILKDVGRVFPANVAWITRMVFLSDWRCALRYRRTITDTRWMNTTLGPYSWEVFDALQRYPKRFHLLVSERDQPHPSAIRVAMLQIQGHGDLSVEDVSCICDVVRATADIQREDLESFVRRTYPANSAPAWEFLDIVALAEEYERSRASSVK